MTELLTEPTELLFSYGTLQLEPVQLATFGRKLHGSPDSPPGYSTSLISIRDPVVVATSGKPYHTIAVRSKDPSDDVTGMVFEITALELAAADRYEVSEYKRGGVRYMWCSGAEI
jgi:hypothetical protein